MPNSASATGLSPAAPYSNGWRTPIVLGALAFTLYVPLIDWGLPLATAPDRTKTFATDEILPLEALAEMHNTFVVSKPDRNYGYPWWHYFLVAVVQAPYVAYLRLSGQMGTPAPEFPFGLHDPVNALRALTVIGRTVSVVMAAATVVAAYAFSRLLWDHATGIAAAALTMLNQLMVYYSRTGNLDAPAFLWSALGLVAFAHILMGGLTVRRAIAFGTFAALAMATKDQALTLFFPLALSLLVPPFNHPPGQRYAARPLLAGLLASLAVYAVATGLVVDPQRHFTHVYSLLFDPSRVTAAGVYWPPYPRTWSGTLGLLTDFGLKAVDAFSLPVLVVALAGAILVAPTMPRLLVLLLPLPALFLMLILPTGVAVGRYLLPLTLIVDAFAAHAILSLRKTRLTVLAVPGLVLLCGWRALIVADLSYAQFYDTRYPAAAWLAAHVKPGERVEYFGVTETLPPLPASVFSRRIAGRVRWVGETGHGEALLHYLASEGPEYLVIVPDWTSRPGMEHSADCPPEVYAAITGGAAGYVESAYFPTPSLLPAPLRRPPLRRPPLDNPSVAPPVRIFSRKDIAAPALDRGST